MASQPIHAHPIIKARDRDTFMLVATGNRHVLFLQGPGSMFFYRFALTLRRSGIKVSKIHLALGDILFWGRRDATVFRCRFAGAFPEIPSGEARARIIPEHAFVYRMDDRSSA